MKFYLYSILFFANICADIPQFNSLNLESFYTSDTYDEAQLSVQIESYPDTEYLNLSGQNVSPSLMALIRNKMPQLKELKLHGFIRTMEGRDTIQWQEVTPEMLGSLIGSNSSIDTLDLSLSTVSDEGLMMISRGAFGLTKISLRGTPQITEFGLSTLLKRIPNIQVIDLSKVTISYPDGRTEEIGPKVNARFLQKLKQRGISIK